MGSKKKSPPVGDAAGVNFPPGLEHNPAMRDRRILEARETDSQIA